MCTKIAKFSGMFFGLIALVLALLGVIGYFIWWNSGGGRFLPLPITGISSMHQ